MVVEGSAQQTSAYIFCYVESLTLCLQCFYVVAFFYFLPLNIS